ncbi:MAG: dihydroorotase, partial [Sandarakinorhabdus sp.]|nr:dihydroorotase [Sandarakinorhabdus sp.]
MKPVLFRNARLIEPAAGTDLRGDLLVAERVIAAVGQGLAAPVDAEIVEANGKVLAPGLIDSTVFRTDVAAAVAGGITSVLLMP